MESRSQVVSSFTIIKGSLIDETYLAFESWDPSLTKFENLARLERENTVGAKSANWLRDVRKVLNRRFDPDGRDRPLVQLAQAGVERAVWTPILLWHMTRDEFLLRDFLSTWLFKQHSEGMFRLRPESVVAYLGSVSEHGGIKGSEDWSTATINRVASGLLRMAADFGLLAGGTIKEFSSYYLPDDAFLYVLHGVAEEEANALRIVESPEWRLFLMDPADVERELLRLHQFNRLRYEAAGSLATLDLGAASLDGFTEELIK